MGLPFNDSFNSLLKVFQLMLIKRLRGSHSSGVPGGGHSAPFPSSVPSRLSSPLSGTSLLLAPLRTFPSEGPLFDGCFVLNLDRRTDRLQHVKHQINRAKLSKLVAPPAPASKISKITTVKIGENIEKVPGIDGLALDVPALHRSGVLTDMAFERYNLPNDEKLFGMDLTPGALGCALSHMRVWELVAERKLERALILEDDVEFAPGFYRSIRERISRVPGDYDIIYFGGLDLLSSNKPPRPFLAEGVRYAYQGHRELTAYVIHAEAAERCLKMSVPMTWQIDTHITSDVKEDSNYLSIDEGPNKGRPVDSFISNPLSYVLQPSLAIQITSLGTDVQKKKADNPSMEDASRRMREFIGGGTSVR